MPAANGGIPVISCAESLKAELDLLLAKVRSFEPKPEFEAVISAHCQRAPADLPLDAWLTSSPEFAQGNDISALLAYRRKRRAEARQYRIVDKKYWDAATAAVHKLLSTQPAAISPHNKAPNAPGYDGRRPVNDAATYPFGSVVRIKTAAGFCSGAFVFDNQTVLTAAHCFYSDLGEKLQQHFKKIERESGTLAAMAAQPLVHREISRRALEDVKVQLVRDDGSVTEELAADVVEIAKQSMDEEDLERFGERASRFDGMYKGRRGSARYIMGDWAVLRLKSPPLSRSIQPFDILHRHVPLESIPLGFDGLISIGFPGDWPSQQLAVNQCKLKERGGFPFPEFVAFRDRKTGHLDVVTTLYSESFCVGFSGMSGGPLLMFDPYTGRYFVLGVRSNSTVSPSSERLKAESEIRKTLPVLGRTHLAGDVRAFDGMFTSIRPGFVMSTRIREVAARAGAQPGSIRPDKLEEVYATEW